ncbi:hypothetical protein PBY51_016010 [Eleginops maclovinus]|uniref:Uncharacterized protein n=1 Tax=Eleginops maclovinus TaxID=56733 RepID=A0AAN7XQ23_ELEMC|nr:hypothetical protein PBY51_016010 [Eleginops maclovinus]
MSRSSVTVRPSSLLQFDSYLRNSMQHSYRLDQRLHMLREEVRTMTRDKERGEQVWRDRLQRGQRQLKAKEEEMSRQSQYFETLKPSSSTRSAWRGTENSACKTGSTP